MRWLINYIRSCFCKHEFEMIDDKVLTNKSGNPCDHLRVYRCKKCGYVQRVYSRSIFEG